MGKAMVVLRSNPWYGLAVDVLLALVLSSLAFAIVGLVVQSFELALILGPVLGVAGAYGLGYRKLRLGHGIRERANALPAAARVVLPIPVAALLALFLLVPLMVVGYVVDVNPALVVALAVVGGLAGAIGLFWFGGTVRDMPGHVRGMGSTGRVLGLVVTGLVVALLLDALVLVLTGVLYLFIGLMAPLAVACIVGLGFLTGWHADATRVVRSWGVLPRIGALLFLFLILTPYAALLVGPVFENVPLAYLVAAALAAIVVVPTGIWMRTFRDAWGGFRALGGEHRVLVVLPTLPLATVLAFFLVAFLVGSFEWATVASLPVGVAVFLASAHVFGLLGDIVPAVRRLRMASRLGVFAGVALVVAAYVAFSTALFGLRIDLAMLAGAACGLLVVAVLVQSLRLGAGLGEEFATYGALGESIVLLTAFVVATALAFVTLGLTTGSFPIAFAVAFPAGLAVTLVLAQVTGLIEGARTVLNELTWWGEFLVLGAIFLASAAYGALVLGLFIPQVALAFALGAAAGLVVLMLAVRFFHVGEDLLTREVHESRGARAAFLVLAFLAGFLVGLGASAAALQVVGFDVFGLPLAVALLGGTAALLGTAAWTGTLRSVLSAVGSGRDAVKVAAIVALWILLGAFTGLAATTVADLDLLIVVAAGVVLWAPLPVLLLRILRVKRTPVRATFAMGEKPRALASLAWGVLGGGIVLVVLLALVDSPVLAFGIAVVAGYLVALLFALRPRRWRSRRAVAAPPAPAQKPDRNA